MTSKPGKHIRKPREIVRIIAIGIIMLLVLGFMADMFSGFYVLRHTKSLYAGIVGIFLLGLFYVIGEAGAEWIGSKDNVSHPLHKRAFRLVLLLIYAGIVMAAIWFFFYYSGLF